MKNTKTFIRFLSLFICVLFITGCDDNKKTYIVSFDTMGGSSVEKQTVASNSNIERPQNPTKEGYTFIGWEKNYATFNFNQKIKSDLVLVAKWQKDSTDIGTTPNPSKPSTPVVNKPTPTNNPSSPEIVAKTKTNTVYKGTSNDVTNFFTIDFKKSTGTIVCKNNNTVITNTKDLSVGTHNILCSITSKEGLSDSASVSIIVRENTKTETIKFSGNQQTQTKTIEIANLDSVISQTVDKGRLSITKDGNKLKIDVTGLNNPNCNTTNGYQETLFYRDGSRCSKFYIYTYVNGIITDVKCVENKCASSVFDSTTHFKTLYPNSQYTSNCSCESQDVLDLMKGYDTKSGWNTALKVGGSETYECVYTAPGGWVSGKTTCTYDYTVTITYKLK